MYVCKYIFSVELVLRVSGENILLSINTQYPFSLLLLQADFFCKDAFRIG
jgi:hypothetical protein